MELHVSCHFVTILSVLNLGHFLIPIFSVQAAAPHFDKGVEFLPCPRNRYVVTNENGTKRCLRCSHCSRGFQLQTKCSVYNNTICEPCQSGLYNDVSGSQCKPCSGCKLGEYIRHSCIAKRDTKCRKCPRDMFSRSSNVTACLRCKRCRQNEEIISKCNGVRDTVCGDCFHGHFRESSTGSCLRCSPCPYKLQHLVVPECRDKLGMHHSNICWPGSSTIRFKELTENIVDVELEEYSNISVTLHIVLGSLISCAVVFLSLSIILYLTKRWKWIGMSELKRERTIGITSEESQESCDYDVIQNKDHASIDTDSVKSIERYNSELN